LAFTTPQSRIAAHPFGHAIRQPGCADARTIFPDPPRNSVVSETRFADSETCFVSNELGFTARVFEFCTTKPARLITPPGLCDNETMTIYIVQKLHWKWNDEAFVLRDDMPVKAFASRRDAEKLCKELEATARQEWKTWHKINTYIGERGRGEEVGQFYEVIAMELEP
jgi:hypothetical protein